MSERLGKAVHEFIDLVVSLFDRPRACSRPKATHRVPRAQHALHMW